LDFEAEGLQVLLAGLNTASPTMEGSEKEAIGNSNFLGLNHVVNNQEGRCVSAINTGRIPSGMIHIALWVSVRSI
jgi:hypothetical protein